jgi:hypothetical protein
MEVSAFSDFNISQLDGAAKHPASIKTRLESLFRLKKFITVGSHAKRPSAGTATRITSRSSRVMSSGGRLLQEVAPGDLGKLFPAYLI